MPGSFTESMPSTSPASSSESSSPTLFSDVPAPPPRSRSGTPCRSPTHAGSFDKPGAAGDEASPPRLPPPASAYHFPHPASRLVSHNMFSNPFNNAVTVLDGRVTVHDESALASPAMDELVRTAVFGEPDEREDARWLIWEIGQAVGVRAASIHDLYVARGQGKCGGFTVPAMNIRGMVYDTARSLFRSAVKLKVGALILEIARSEIAYTDQRPPEYVAVMLAAALREGFRGPVFIQGDHFQVNAKKYAVDPKPEVDAVKALAREAIAAGFYNIDIDTSTLVDISKASLDEQQRLNYEVGIDILS